MTIKKHPILMSSPMIQAILNGQKTQTRRVIAKPKVINEFPNLLNSVYKDGDGNWIFWSGDSNDHVSFTKKAYPTGSNQGIKCPYGQVGDRLWVRETWHKSPHGIIYKADWDDDTKTIALDEDGEKVYVVDKWKPSIHMPRSACRVLLEITGIRVEQLQDISEEDAIAEGAERFDNLASIHSYGSDCRWSMKNPRSTDECLLNARFAFANLWDSINAKKHPWDSNPWVWVIEFKQVEQTHV